MTSEDLLDSAHLRERGYFDMVEHAQSPPSPYARLGWRSDSWRSLPPAPLFAQHLGEAVSLLGVRQARVAELVASGAVAREPRYR